MNPRFPLYIVSKGRSETRYTSKALEEAGVPYFIVIEEQELPAYSAVIDPKKILILDKKYQNEYDTFDTLGFKRSKGPGAARNFVWDHATRSGAEYHWVMDDNITGFYRLNNNLKLKVGDGTIFRCMEDFVLRYKNVAMAGPNYFMFASRKSKMPPFVFNTRIYSCNLIKNRTPFRWRGRYNEDTDLSLRMLKAGLCTVQFNAFLQYKLTTMTVAGGNHSDLYSKYGTLLKSQMLVRMHPDVAKVVYKFGRWHHHVDYSGFKKLEPILRDPAELDAGIDNYGMELKIIRPDYKRGGKG